MYVIEVAGVADELSGRLVARIMPDPATAALETAAQHHLSNRGFPAPAIRVSGAPSAEFDRAWTVMEFAPGQPLLAGLTASTALRNAPTLLRRLPDLLAEAAAELHRCPTDGFCGELGEDARRPEIRDSLDRIGQQALAVGRPDLQRAAALVAAAAPDGRVICHGDLHPFNLLVDGDRWTLIDWSTTVLADPHYDLAFTTMMLANPPLGGPAPVRAAARLIGRRLAKRFVRTYQRRAGYIIDGASLAWGQQAHALRALVEIAGWEAHGELDAHRGHPWLMLRPAFETCLASLAPSRRSDR
jgi:aminoglycoside phosphotransferase (APT) family kinase protein